MGIDVDSDESDVISTAPTSAVSLSVRVRDHVVAGGPPRAVPRECLDTYVGEKLALSQEDEERCAGPLDNIAADPNVSDLPCRISRKGFQLRW